MTGKGLTTHDAIGYAMHRQESQGVEGSGVLVLPYSPCVWPRVGSVWVSLWGRHSCWMPSIWLRRPSLRTVVMHRQVTKKGIIMWRSVCVCV
jgi:hypothetical protein